MHFKKGDGGQKIERFLFGRTCAMIDVCSHVMEAIKLSFVVYMSFIRIVYFACAIHS